jgi:peptidoglycan/LPS O-acetylase OafA/YrhL
MTNSDSPNRTLNYIRGFDGIRGIAVVAVMLLHYMGPFNATLKFHDGLWPLFVRLCGYGWVGVDLFFALSGYLITKILLRTELTPQTFRTFLIRRALRLLPAYFACVAITLAAAYFMDPGSKIVSNQVWLWTVSTNIFGSFFDRVGFADRYFSLFHFWSLTVEWHFYLLFSLLLLLKLGARAVAVGFILTAIACRLWFVAQGWSDNAIYSFTFCRLDALGFGCLAATLANPPKVNLSRLTLGALLVFATVLVITSPGGVAFKRNLFLQTAGYSLIALCAATMVYYVARASIDNRVVAYLENPVLKRIGRISYSLYLWHLVFWPTIYRIVASNIESIPLQYFVAAAAATLLTFACGYASFIALEQGLERYRSHYVIRLLAGEKRST